MNPYPRSPDNSDWSQTNKTSQTNTVSSYWPHSPASDSSSSPNPSEPPSRPPSAPGYSPPSSSPPSDSSSCGFRSTVWRWCRRWIRLGLRRRWGRREAIAGRRAGSRRCRFGGWFGGSCWRGGRRIFWISIAFWLFGTRSSRCPASFWRFLWLRRRLRYFVRLARLCVESLIVTCEVYRLLTTGLSWSVRTSSRRVTINLHLIEAFWSFSSRDRRPLRSCRRLCGVWIRRIRVGKGRSRCIFIWVIIFRVEGLSLIILVWLVLVIWVFIGW